MQRTWPSSIGGALARAGAARLHRLAPALDAADPGGRVVPRSRLLCAALGSLAEACYGGLGGGLGGRGRAEEVGDAAALLSLLTKLDDQVIDAPAFHRGLSRRDAGEKTRAFLAPTLTSICEARPAAPAGRCLLAAELGARLRRLAL